MIDRATGGLGLWVRSEWRNGWKALVGLAVLIALGGGLTLAAIGGARRADSAFDRFRDAVSSPVEVTSSGAYVFGEWDNAWADLTEPMAKIPGVRGVTPLSYMGVAVQTDGPPSVFFMIAAGRGVGDRPPPGFHVIEGRAADPSVVDEVMVNETAAARYGVGVGDSITLVSYSLAQADSFSRGDLVEPQGPTIDATVTGIFRSPEDISDNPQANVMLTAAFHDAYADEIVHCDCSFWLGASAGDADRVAAALPTVIGDYPLTVQNVASPSRVRVERSVALEVGALRIAALIAAVASLLVVAQALARHLDGETRTVAALDAIGATRPQVVRGWAVVLVPVVVAGALGAIGVATALSPLFPRGLARRAEIDTGVRFDTLAFIGGGALIALGTFGLVVTAAWLATRRHVQSTAPRPRAWARSLAPAASLGASFALAPSRDRSRLVAFGAIGGLVLAIGGAVSVALIERSISDVMRTPSAFSADWDMELTSQPEDQNAVIAAVAADPAVEAFGLQFNADGSTRDIEGPTGTTVVEPQTFQDVKGSMGPLIDQGRPAATANDVVIGRAIADRIGAHIGDEVTVVTDGEKDQTFVVSGIGRMTNGDETDLVFATTPDGQARIMGAGQSPNINGGFVRLGNDDAAARARLADLGFVSATPPARIANLRQIGSVPKLLAVALALLGLGGVIHGLLVAGDRRRGDIAVARALGFTRGQAASTIRWQGFTITAIAVVVGLPLGMVVGRLIWKQIADGVGAVDLVTIPWAVIVVAPLVSVAVITVTASIVGRRVARLRPAEALRSE